MKDTVFKIASFLNTYTRSLPYEDKLQTYYFLSLFLWDGMVIVLFLNSLVSWAGVAGLTHDLLRAIL